MTVANFESIETPDKYTVVFNLVNPALDFLQRITTAPAWVTSTAAFDDIGRNGFIAKPTGTGAFQFEDGVLGTHVEIVAFDEYWNGRPRIDRVTNTVISDSNTYCTAFENGELDMIELYYMDKVNEYTSMGFKEHYIPMPQHLYAGLNMQLEPFTDPKVREALFYAFDPQYFVDELYLGLESVPTGWIPTLGVEYALEGYCTPEYNPEKSKALLAEAGHPDGVSFKLWCVNDELCTGPALIAKQQLVAAGFNVDLQLVDFNVFMENVRGPLQRAGCSSTAPTGSPRSPSSDGPATTTPAPTGSACWMSSLTRPLPTPPPRQWRKRQDASDEEIEIYRNKHGLNEPLPVQLAIALKNFVTGDLGKSISQYKPVTRAIAERFPNTVELALLGILVSGTLSILFGVIAAVYRGKWSDFALMTYSTIGMSMPSFYIGLWVLVIFARKLNVIPVLSNMPGVPHWKGLFGPLVTIALGSTATLMRTSRSSMLEIFDEDFIRTARVKGLSEKVILFRHALGNALIPIVTIVGYNLATSFGGATMLETMFTRNGMGKLLVDAIGVRDYPLIQGTTIIIAILMILINILTDVVYGYVDPRIRISGEEH